jgi:hypothetical protein
MATLTLLGKKKPIIKKKMDKQNYTPFNIYQKRAQTEQPKAVGKSNIYGNHSGAGLISASLQKGDFNKGFDSTFKGDGKKKVLPPPEDTNPDTGDTGEGEEIKIDLSGTDTKK